jgi:hypothetical protein
MHRVAHADAQRDAHEHDRAVEGPGHERSVLPTRRDLQQQNGQQAFIPHYIACLERIDAGERAGSDVHR